METSKKKMRTGEVNKYGWVEDPAIEMTQTPLRIIRYRAAPILPRHFVACLFGMRLSRKYIMHTTITYYFTQLTAQPHPCHVQAHCRSYTEQHELAAHSLCHRSPVNAGFRCCLSLFLFCRRDLCRRLWQLLLPPKHEFSPSKIFFLG